MRGIGLILFWALFGVPVELLGTACGGSESGETSMDLELKLELDREEYLYGESIVPRLTLVNRGMDPIRIPSLSFNDSVVGLMVLDEAGNEIGTYRRYHVNQRRGRERVTYDNVEMIELQPAESERAEKRLHLYREPLPPGRYRFVGRYDWVDAELRSNAVELSVHPSRPKMLALGWDRQFVQPYHLLYAWLDVWKGEPLLMQAGTFTPDPRILYFASRVPTDVSQPIDDLQVARNLVERDGYRSVLLWKSGERLCFRTLGEVERPQTHEISPDLPDWSVVPPVYRGNEDATVILLTNPARSEVLALELRAEDGSARELERIETSTARLQACAHSLLHGSFYVFVADEAEGSTLQVVPLGGGAAPTRLWQTAQPVVTIATAVSRKEEAILVVGRWDPASGPEPSLRTRIFRGAAFDEQLEGPSFALPEGADCQLGLGVDGTVHVLARTVQGTLLYARNGQAPQPVTGLDDLVAPPGLVVGFKDAAFAVGATPDRGVAIRPLGPVVTR